MLVIINITKDELQTFLKFVSSTTIDVVKIEPNDKGNLKITLIVDSRKDWLKLSEVLFD